MTTLKIIRKPKKYTSFEKKEDAELFKAPVKGIYKLRCKGIRSIFNLKKGETIDLKTGRLINC
jgi:hypothetical protein